MRILFAIPHYFAPSAAPNYGSERTAPELRARVTQQCIASLWQHFSEAQSLANGFERTFLPANPRLSATITVVLCTTGESHLIPEITGSVAFQHVATGAEPRYLGFECHKVLREGLGQYDYFGYLEDDLRIADGLFFVKLAWFQTQFGEAALLQPNRFELTGEPAPYKLYIDGNPRDHTLVSPQRSDGQPRIAAPAFGRPMHFQRVYNPHSGCFFLSAAQLARWVEQPDFAVPSAAFCGPLESAATLGVMRHFRIYKPARENAAFLEIEHLDKRYLGRVFTAAPGDPPTVQWS